MASLELTAGPWDQGASVLIAVGSLAYALACGLHVRRAFQARLPDRWSAAGTTLALVVIAGIMAFFGPRILPSPFGPSLLLVIVGGVLFTLLFTAFRLQRVVEQLKQALPLPPLAQPTDHETRRKVPHLLMGCGLLLYAGLGHFLLVGIVLASGPAADRNLLAVRDAPWAASGHLLGIWALLAVLFILLPVELVRLRFPDTDYPWKRIILSRLRRREAGLMGAHIHMCVGLAAAYLVLSTDLARWPITVPACIALFAVTVFADTASALAGMRWGTTKWFHNPGKSYVGSIGGTLVAFLVAMPFVGIPMAIASALVFLLVDVVGPVPIPISDNLLNPGALALLYAALPNAITPMVRFL